MDGYSRILRLVGSTLARIICCVTVLLRALRIGQALLDDVIGRAARRGSDRAARRRLCQGGCQNGGEGEDGGLHCFLCAWIGDVR